MKVKEHWTDLLSSFGVALLLHGLVILGAIWFWTVRPSTLRPVFQVGDASLAVTFVAAADGGRTADDRQRTADDRGQKTEDGRQLALRSLGEAGTTDSAVEPQSEEGEDPDMPVEETAAPVAAQASANMPEDRGQRTEDRRQMTEDRGQTADDGRQKTDSAAAAPRQGVSGTVRMKSEVRPYYPLGARLRGEEGVVAVRVWVNSSGRALRCAVARSSGYSALDEAAMDAARRARYVSTQPGAWRAEAETTLTFRFRLTE